MNLYFSLNVHSRERSSNRTFRINCMKTTLDSDFLCSAAEGVLQRENSTPEFKINVTGQNKLGELKQCDLVLIELG